MRVQFHPEVFMARCSRAYFVSGSGLRLIFYPLANGQVNIKRFESCKSFSLESAIPFHHSKGF
jgi:hypothetical protein